MGVAGEWMDVHLPFASLIPTVRTTTIPVSQRRKFQGAASDPLSAGRDVPPLPFAAMMNQLETRPPCVLTSLSPALLSNL
jgi:hypothetical protein